MTTLPREAGAHRAFLLRATLEAAVERAIAALDAFDGDPDLEEQCEDEGAACEDEGFCHP